MKFDNSNAQGLNDDEPLDPAVERVRRKMMRLMGISVAIMMIGLMAVIGAIFYKISGAGKKNVQPVVSDVPKTPQGKLDTMKDLVGSINLPDGSRMLRADMDGNRILLRVRHLDGAIELWVYDLANNRVFAKIAISR